MAERRGVVRNRPEGPSFRPLQRTSAALHEVLRVCFLRAAFLTDDRFSEVRAVSTASILGRVSHRLLEEAAQGKFDSPSETDLEQEVAHEWDRLVKFEERAMRERLLDVPPVRIKWPGYALRRATACRTASYMARRRSHGFSGTASAPLEPAVAQAEVWYEGYGGRLAGRVDLIRRTSTGIEMVDYKSGLVVDAEETEGGIGSVREPYERQMLIYAGLVHDNEGQWPIKATVESLVQGPHEIQVTPQRVQDVVDEALNLLASYNRQVAAEGVRGQPSNNACRWCDFKAICRDFLETAEDSWEMPVPTVAGRLGAVSLGPPSFFELHVTGGDHPKETIAVRAIPLGVALQLSELQGATLSFSGLRRTLGSNDLVFEWTAQSWHWASEGA